MSLWDENITADVISGVDQDTTRRNTEISAKQKTQKEAGDTEANKELARIEKDKISLVALLEMARAGAHKKRQAEYQSELNLAGKNVALARKELEAVKAKAAAARKKAEAEGEDVPTKVEDLLNKLKESFAGIGDAKQAGPSVIGTFSAVAAFGLGSGDGANERTASASEKSAKLNAEISANTKKNPTFK